VYVVRKSSMIYETRCSLIGARPRQVCVHVAPPSTTLRGAKPAARNSDRTMLNSLQLYVPALKESSHDVTLPDNIL